MGIGEIVSEVGEGVYNVRLKLLTTRIESRRVDIQNGINALEMEIVEAEAVTVAAALDLQTANAALTNILMQVYATPPTATRDQTNTVLKDKIIAVNTFKEAESTEARIRLRLASLKKELQRLVIPENPVVKAQCVDLNKDLTPGALVGTIEPIGEQREGIPILITPGGQLAGYDGQLQPILDATPFGALLSMCLRPAWQKWKPLYRLGSLVQISDDYTLCRVLLDEATTVVESRGKIINLNKKPILADIPKADYDTFKYSAIDRVIVRFKDQDWNQAEVFGLAGEALECEFSALVDVRIKVGTVRWVIGPVLGGIYYPIQGLFGRKCGLEVDLNYDESEVQPTRIVSGLFEGFEQYQYVKIGGYTSYRFDCEISGYVFYRMLDESGKTLPLGFTRWAPVPNYPWSSEPSEPIPVCSDNWTPTETAPWIPYEDVYVTGPPRDWGAEDVSNEITFSRIDFLADQIKILLKDETTQKINTFWANVADIDVETKTLPFPDVPWVATLTGDEFVTIIDINTAPVAFDGTYTTKEDVMGFGVLTATDADGDTLTYRIVDNGTKGFASITNPTSGAYRYTPNLNANGDDSFTFVANDGVQNSNEATVTVTITPVNDAPILSVGSAPTYIEGGTVSANPGVTIIDVDDVQMTGAIVAITSGLADGDMLSMATQNGLSGNYNAGTLTITGTATKSQYQSALRSVQFSSTNDKPAAISATRSITWTVKDANADGDGAQTSNPVTSIIHVVAVNDPPVLTAGAILAYTENGPAAVIDATITLSDADDTQITGATVAISDGLTFADILGFFDQFGISGIYVHGTGILTLSGVATLADYQTALRSITYYSTNDNPTKISTSRTITWTVTDANSDGVGAATSLPVTSTINITAVNDAPIAYNSAFETPMDVLLNGFVVGIDPELKPMTYTIVSNGSKGTATLTNPALGSFTYSPNPGETGEDTFTFKAFDGVLYSNTATINITIIPL